MSRFPSPVHVFRVELHARSDHIVGRRLIPVLREIWQEMAVRQYVALEMALVHRVIEQERRLERADISAVMREQLFAGNQFRSTVTVQIS